MRHFILLLLSSSYLSLSVAETIDGPANIRSKPSGKVIASIVDNIKLKIRSQKDGWFEVEIPVYVNRKEAPDVTTTIPAHTNLYNFKNEIIGKTVANATFDGGPDGDEDKYQGAIVGYTANTNIRPESILETEIEKILADNNFSLNEKWLAHIKNSGYEPWIAYGDFENFEVYEENALDIDRQPRIILFFYQKQLFAILHNKPINFSNFGREEKFGHWDIQYLAKTMTKRTYDDFEREFLRVLGSAW